MGKFPPGFYCEGVQRRLMLLKAEFVRVGNGLTRKGWFEIFWGFWCLIYVTRVMMSLFLKFSGHIEKVLIKIWLLNIN